MIMERIRAELRRAPGDAERAQAIEKLMSEYEEEQKAKREKEKEAREAKAERKAGRK